MTLEDEHDRVMTLMKNLLQFFSNTNIVKPDQIKNVSWLWVLWVKKVEKLKSCGTPSLWNVKRFFSLKTVFFSLLYLTGFSTCVWLFFRYPTGYSTCPYTSGKVHWHVCPRWNHSNLLYYESPFQVCVRARFHQY